MPGGISFDRVAGVYASSRALPAGVASTVADRLADRLGAGWALEVGVGTGRWAVPLQQRGVRLAGVDLSVGMLQVGWTDGARDLIRGDVCRLPCRDRAFGAVLAAHLLHLVFDVPTVLEEIARVTTGRMCSVLEFETARPNLVDTYRALATEAGLDVAAPGLGERALVLHLRPDRREETVVFHSRAPAGPTLDLIQRRAFRDTWGAPDEPHAAIASRLRAEFSQAEVLTQTRIEIVEWSGARLGEFARAWRRIGRTPPILEADPG
ncbi:MAG: class I SAM-dependent methyltransferase [Thermoplasmata archaeon]|nr:class I SAM-dependent methyltransferase [Thermoplasmata archaeon]